MGKPIRIAFRVDADEKSGLGHLSRCRSLMRALQGLAGTEFFIVSNNAEAVKKFIPDIAFHYSERFVQGIGFDMVVVDLLEGPLQKEGARPGGAGLLVCIDDDGPGMPDQDILIRPNLLDLPRPAEMDPDNYWSGRDHIILNPDFSLPEYRWTARGGEPLDLLVCFGGSDYVGLTPRVVPILKKLKVNMRVRLVMGAAFSRRKEVDALVAGDQRFLASGHISDMAQFLSRAAVAFISGGTMLYEVCSLGVPAVVLSQNRAQDIEAAICHRAGAVINLGVNEDVQDQEISEALERVLGDPALRESLSAKGPRVVSPDGVMRIASRLIARVKGGASR